MNRVYLETEHQELFYPEANLRKPIAVHIPSALGTLGYYVCLRVPAKFAGQFADTVTRLRVGGLRPDDVTLRFGEGVRVPAALPSRVAGQTWILLARAFVSRGDGELSFKGLPAGLKQATALLCTWPRFVESGQADDWLACQADPMWATGGVPLGGIGTGKVELCRDGRFRNYSGNNNQDMPFEEPDGLDGAYLAVAVDGVEKIVATRTMAGLQPVRRLQSRLAFPQVTLEAKAAFPGIDVRITASGPVVPQDVQLSSLPGFVVRWEITSRSAAKHTVRCRLAWPNLVGQGGGIGAPETRTGYADGFYRFWEAPERPLAEAVRGKGWLGLRYGNDASPVCASADGHHYLGVLGRADSETGGDAGRGWVAKTMEIEPRGQAEAWMAVAWEMPHWIDSQGQDRGQFWQTHAADGAAVVERLLKKPADLLSRAGALSALLADTTLPRWLQDRLCNCCYPLVTNSVFYRDGRFSVNEGPTEMAGCYGTLDQRLGAHPATQLLFPELNRRELQQFANLQHANGGVNHDFGGGHLESEGRDQPWPDLTCSFILQLARHSWSTGDRAFEATNWPKARKALLRHKLWADAGGGVAQVGKELGTSYDGYHYFGTTPYVGTLWLATLAVARRWAERMADAELVPMIDELARQATAKMDTDLWNGSYYRAYEQVGGPRNDNCHAGMLAGETYSRLLTGTDVLPEGRLRQCAKAWLQLNGNAKFAVPPDEVSADLREWAEFGWLPYVECFGVAPLVYLGESGALTVWRRMVAAMDGNGAHPCDTRLMYQPVNGLPSWGAYYMTGPASWLVYDATTQFWYEPETGLLRLWPIRNGKFAIVHPLFWGVAERQGRQLCLTVTHVWTPKRLELREWERTERGKAAVKTAFSARLTVGAVIKLA